MSEKSWFVKVSDIIDTSKDDTGFGNLFDSVDEADDLQEENPVVEYEDDDDDDDEETMPKVDPEIVDHFVNELSKVKDEIFAVVSDMYKDLQEVRLDNPPVKQLFQVVKTIINNMESDTRLDEHWTNLHTNSYLALARLKTIFFENDTRMQILDRLLSEVVNKQSVKDFEDYKRSISSIRSELHELLPIYNMYWKKFRKN